MRCHFQLERMNAKKGKGGLYEMENKKRHYNGTTIWTESPYRKSIPALGERKVVQQQSIKNKHGHRVNLVSTQRKANSSEPVSHFFPVPVLEDSRGNGANYPALVQSWILEENLQLPLCQSIPNCVLSICSHTPR